MADGYEIAQLQGAIIMLIILVIAILTGWHMQESFCQTGYNVSDCEISITFNPKERK